LISLIWSVFLTACQHLPYPLPEQLTAQYQAQTQLKSWSLIGTLGIRLDHHASRAQVIWQQQPDHYELTLQGPLGSGAARLIGTQQGVILITPEETRHAQNIETLIAQRWGWSVPMEYLLWWAKGLPIPHLPLQGLPSYDTQHRFTSFVQEGWTINLAEYKTTVTDHAAIPSLVLPYRIILNTASLRLTLVVLEWKNLNF
jgi:outer membrane lipoprotein LolB